MKDKFFKWNVNILIEENNGKLMKIDNENINII